MNLFLIPTVFLYINIVVRTRAHSVGKQTQKKFVNIFRINFAYMWKIMFCVNIFQIFLESSLGYFEKKTYICIVKNNYFMLV